MAQTLLNYITDTRFLLHDPNSKTFTDQQIISSINKARDRVTTDVCTPQAVVSISLVTGQEQYPFNSILSAVQSLPGSPPARAIQAVLAVNFVQAVTTKQPLEPFPWSTLNERYRQTPVNSLPEAYGLLDIGGPLSTLWIEPAPSAGNWTIAIRCVWLANPMAAYTDLEQAVPSPLAEVLVPFMAARWCWSFNDDEEMSDKFEQKYEREKAALAAAMPPFASPTYASVYG